MPAGIVKLREIKPSLYGYLRDALTVLHPGEIPDECTVHDVRVLMKRSRAVIKLIQPQVSNTISEREYLSYRETGRLMRSWRENSVHRKTLRTLRKKYPPAFNYLENNKVIIDILNIEDLNADDEVRMKEDLEMIIDILRRSAYRIRFTNLDKLEPDLLFKELISTYSDVSKCFLQARNRLKPGNLHEFRKRAKDFLYQLYFFRQINPKVIKSLEKRLDIMTQNLGKYNDLNILVDKLGYGSSKCHENNGFDELVLAVRQEQDKCLFKVWPDAYKIFNPRQTLTSLLGYRMLGF